MTGKNKPQAIIFHGGWDGHQPREVAARYGAALADNGFEVNSTDTQDVLDDFDLLCEAALIVPIWTMGELGKEREKNLCAAVDKGTGLGGFHGGMGDAFRGSIDYQFMVGGQFVGHPHVGPYSVEVKRAGHPVMAGMPARFDYDSEQYYMLVDPAIDVLATTEYDFKGVTCTMPVVWVRTWGKGRVFYSALGHQDAEFDTYPHVMDMTLRGMLWAARDAG